MATMSSKTNAAPWRRLSRAILLGLAFACAAGLAVLVSGCGGSSGTPVAQIASTTTSTTSTTAADSSSGSSSANPAAYSACMRKHGVPNFPDPDSQGRIKITSGMVKGHPVGLNVNAPQFKAAQQSCQKLQPKGGKPSAQEQAKEQQTMLKHSACMRSHGVPKFPDPTFSPDGGATMMVGPRVGVDPNSAQFKAAEKACGTLFGGGNMIGPGPSTSGAAK